MTVTISHAEKVPTISEINEIEALLPHALPADYLGFLISGKAGKPESNIFNVSDNIDSGIAAFITVDRLMYERDLLRQEIGDDVLPIAYAEGGNYICIVISGPTIGSIYFFDHECHGPEALTAIAPGFTAFLEKVEPFNSESVRLKPGQVKKVWVNPAFLKKQR